jgi:ABC-2 type transport system permease protein
MTAVMTIVEGIYKTSSLLFNCKDDQLLLSLPISRRAVLFTRMFKFYVFELEFHSLFIIPLAVAYIRWAENLQWTFFLTTAIMILLLPIIPIVISCIIGVITTGISSRFKYKNLMQIVISMTVLVGILLLSYNLDGAYTYIAEHATSINDMITKLYYPAGAYANLAVNFNIVDLLIFIAINLGLFGISLLILSKFYFKINSRSKSVITSKKTKKGDIKYTSRSSTMSLVHKEINTFFKTPVFIINAGFGVVLFIIAVIVITVKFDSILPVLTDPVTMDISEKDIMNNIPVLIFLVTAMASFMTSITNSMISLEGRGINILKSLPINPKKILLSKVYAASVITMPAFILGDIILCIRFNVGIIETLLILILTIVVPLIPHFIGLIFNLKYPKLDWDNPAEVVKQSTSSFISVMCGFMLLMATVLIVMWLMERLTPVVILIIVLVVFSLIDLLLYLYLSNKGVKEFNNLSV